MLKYLLEFLNVWNFGVLNKIQFPFVCVALEIVCCLCLLDLFEHTYVALLTVFRCKSRGISSGLLTPWRDSCIDFLFG